MGWWGIAKRIEYIQKERSQQTSQQDNKHMNRHERKNDTQKQAHINNIEKQTAITPAPAPATTATRTTTYNNQTTRPINIIFKLLVLEAPKRLT